MLSRSQIPEFVWKNEFVRVSSMSLNLFESYFQETLSLLIR